MSLEFNNPLYIGDPDAAAKTDISQLKQDIGDMSQLETADKSSLVNALNEAIDSTLNGASRDLDNLSDEGNDKLRSLNAYANEGELLTDPDGLAFVEKYAHSTFDRSKFTVVGSPNVTDDGIASGFSASNYIKLPDYAISCEENDDWEMEFVFKTGSFSHSYSQIIINNGSAANTDGGSSKGFGIYSQSDTTSTPQLILFFDEVTYQGNITYTSGFVENTNYRLVLGQDSTKRYATLYNLDNNTSTYQQVLLSTLTSNIKTYWTVGGNMLIGKQISSNGVDNTIDLKGFKFSVNGVVKYSGNKTGVDTIKPDDYTVVGTPTISADGVASGFTTSNYLEFTLGNSTSSNWEIDLEFKTPLNRADVTEAYQGLLSKPGALFQIYSNLSTATETNFVITTEIQNAYPFQLPVSWNTNYKVVLKCSNGSYYSSILNLDTNELFIPSAQEPLPSIFYLSGTFRLGTTESGGYSFNGSIDLNAFKIYVDGNLVYQPCLKIPFTESKTGSKIVNSIYRDRVNDMAEQFGYANYYTLSDTDFTLPQVELYGLIGQRTLRDSYRNGINYWELYSNRDLEQGGSCTSGVEVTFARPFADTNYVLSVPYSAKSVTAFTPTQTGDWIAKGKGLL